MHIIHCSAVSNCRQPRAWRRQPVIHHTSFTSRHSLAVHGGQEAGEPGGLAAVVVHRHEVDAAAGAVGKELVPPAVGWQRANTILLSHSHHISGQGLCISLLAQQLVRRARQPPAQPGSGPHQAKGSEVMQSPLQAVAEGDPSRRPSLSPAGCTHVCQSWAASAGVKSAWERTFGSLNPSSALLPAGMAAARPSMPHLLHLRRHGAWE